MDEAKIDGSEIEFLSKEEDKRFAKGLCKIEIQSPGEKKTASGFLCIFQLGIMEFVVGMFTNHHVLDEEKNYFMTRENYRYEITKDQIKRFWTNEDMDVTFVAFKKKFAKELVDNDGWHFFEVSGDEIAVDSSVTILQHPEGGGPRVSRGKITLRADDTLRHTASTLAGSSGSPLLDIHYRVFGIHKQGNYFPNDKEHGMYNIGTVIKCAIEKITSTSNETDSSSNESRPPIEPKIKSRGVQFSPATQTDDEQNSTLSKEIEDLRDALKKALVEKETLTESNLEYSKKVKDLPDKNSELRERLRNGEVSLVTSVLYWSGVMVLFIFTLMWWTKE